VGHDDGGADAGGRGHAAALKQSFAADPKPRVCNQAARILGSLCRPFPAEASDTNIPSNLNYLPNTSFVRYIPRIPLVFILIKVTHFYMLR
jgi:hypothetical protein